MTSRKIKGPKKPSVTIQPSAYPKLTCSAAMSLLHALRDPKVAADAARIIASKAEHLRGAVLGHIGRMEMAARDFDIAAIFEQAHEIRGLAGNAGLNATGRIANGLCRYLDAAERAGQTPERSLVALHLEAIARAANAEDEATRLGDAVANELAKLTDKKLAEINDPARR